MKLPAQTRSVVERNYAIIYPDGYVHSRIPGWTGCITNILISERMHAGICQLLVTMDKDAQLKGKTEQSQLFFYLIDGECIGHVDNHRWTLRTGQFVYIPAGRSYYFQDPAPGTKILIFQKVYLPLQGYDRPEVVIGDKAKISAEPYLGDPSVNLQMLLPDLFSFDFAVNILTFQPGAHLPFAETHVMEHGLLFLKGQAICLLHQEWYLLDKGVSIWMAPYCSQWLAAIGQQPLVYIYCKDINRFPATP